MNNQGLDNTEIASDYDVNESKTAKIINDDSGNQRDMDMIFGVVNFEGTEYSDKMCLF